MNKRILIGAAVLLTAGIVQAAIIQPVAIDDHSSEFNASQAAELTIDGSGFIDDPVTATSLSATGGPDDLHWLTRGVVENQFITFDLGAEYDLTATYVWNYAFPGNNRWQRGVKQFDVVAAGSDKVFDTTAGTDLILAAGGEAATEAAQTLAITASAVRYVRFEIDSNQLDETSQTGKYAGLSEVRFEGTVVPEPATLGLVAVFGGAVLFIRRRFMI